MIPAPTSAPTCAPDTCLISAADLIPLAFDPHYVILDCRHDLLNPQYGRTAYASGHIPGAQFVSIDDDLSGVKDGPIFRGRHPLPDPDVFIATLRHLGVDAGSRVIAYDAHGGMYAARLWWMLRWIGHANVMVLDGGLQAWQELGCTLEQQVPEHAPGTITRQPSLVGTVDAATVMANLDSQTMQVIDARAPDRFRGENETIDPVGGHIPGAKNRFFKDNLKTDGKFKSATQLRAELSAILPDAQTGIMQCGSGVSACHNLLALEVAGMHGAKLYPGSWSEWCADPARPIASGA